MALSLIVKRGTHNSLSSERNRQGQLKLEKMDWILLVIIVLGGGYLSYKIKVVYENQQIIVDNQVSIIKQLQKTES